MRVPRSVTSALLVAAAAVVVSACGQPAGDDVAPATDGGPAAATSTVNGGVPEPVNTEPRPTLASQDVRIEGYDLHVAVHELSRRDRLAELTFSVTRTDDKEQNWQVGDTFGGSTQSNSTLNVSGVELLDTANGKLHTVALDQEGNCVCTGEASGIFLDAGDSVLFSATYAAPPENVSAMGVRIPTVGTFNDVPLS